MLAIKINADYNVLPVCVYRAATERELVPSRCSALRLDVLIVDMTKQLLSIIAFFPAMPPIASDLNHSIYPDICMMGLEVGFNVIARAPVDIRLVTCLAIAEPAAVPLLSIRIHHRECLVFT